MSGSTPISSIAVLGAGRVGSAIARDLHARGDVQVVSVDVNADHLQRLERDGVSTRQVNLADTSSLETIGKTFDLTVGAVPGAMGFSTLRTILATGTPCVDISFFGEDHGPLDPWAKKHNAFAAFDCGVAPGLSNWLFGYHHAQMDSMASFRCLVGGLPQRREEPFQYKAPFSPGDVIEEYTRPARFRRNARAVTLPALTEVEHLEVKELGTLEAFNSDGLRSLLAFDDVPDMVEKTLRYPGHARLMEIFRDAGFFATEPLKLGSGKAIAPRDVTSQLLFDAWHLAPDDEDLTVMEIEITGVENGQPVTHLYHLFDRADLANQVSSMARTTGYMATAVVHAIMTHGIPESGLHAPEQLAARPGWHATVMSYLKQRGIQLDHEQLDQPGVD